VGASHVFCVADTARDLEALAEQFSELAETDLAALWVSGYESEWGPVFSSYYRTGHGVPEHRVAAAKRLVGSWRTCEAARVRAHGLVAAAADRLADALGLVGGVPYVVMFGTGDSNGWVTVFEGQPTLFLAVELLPDAPYDEVLIVHELVHVAHQSHASYDDEDASVGEMLLQEGIATALSARLRPGLAPDDYLWFGRPGVSRWRASCLDVWDRCVSDIVSLAGSREVADVRRFFSGSEISVTDGVPGRAGYLIGALGVEQLLETVPVDQLLGQPVESVTPRLLEAIQQIDPRSPEGSAFGWAVLG
jgi:hypothetical protein